VSLEAQPGRLNKEEGEPTTGACSAAGVGDGRAMKWYNEKAVNNSPWFDALAELRRSPDRRSPARSGRSSVFSPQDAPSAQPTKGDLALSRSLYLASKESEKTANNAAGPKYISTHPARVRELSVNPPQSTPIVAIFALPAASAS
jgi:hypothetical protein